MYENGNEEKNTEGTQNTENNAVQGGDAPKNGATDGASADKGHSWNGNSENADQGSGASNNGNFASSGNGNSANNGQNGDYGNWNSYGNTNRGDQRYGSWSGNGYGYGNGNGYRNGDTNGYHYGNGYGNSYGNGNPYGNGGYRPTQQTATKKNGWIIPVAIILCVALCIGSFVFGANIVWSILSDATDGGDGDVNGGGDVNTNGGGSSSGAGNPYLANGDWEPEQLPSDSKWYTIPSVVQMTKDTVVEITTETVTTGSYWGQYITTGAGSGVVIESYSVREGDVEGEDKSKTGTYIVTNNHVIEGANSIKVTLTNGETYPAILVATDAETDVAVIRIDEKDLPTAKLGKSSELVAGQGVVVIGNPLGSLGGSVTDGIISCTERDITVDGRVMKLIQTNAAVNPGNSGGALFDLEGRLVGIVNAKYSDEEVEGIGFAIPIDTVVKIAADLRNYGYVTGRPNIGITAGYGYGLSGNTYVTYEGNSVTGIWVDELDEASDSYKAGMRQGDYIASIEFDGTTYTFTSLIEFNTFINTLKPGDALTVNVYRFTKKALNAFYYTFERDEQSFTFTLTEYTLSSQSAS